MLRGLAGAVAGLGVFVALAGGRGRAALGIGGAAHGGVNWRTGFQRLGLAILAAVPVLAATRWWVAAGLAGAGAAWWPTARRAAGSNRRERATVEALATWVEQLRDTLAGAHGLHSAIVATAAVAPTAIAPAVQALAARLDYQRLGPALDRFAADVDHPLADFVVVALGVADQHQARDLTGLLGHLADSARQEAAMRTRVWVARARSRTSVKVMAATVPTMVMAVMVVDRPYLAPYDGAGGQVALAVAVSLFLVSFIAMERMGRIRMPDRFGPRPTPVSS